MAELRQQYLDILQGYGVDPAGLRNATEAQLRRMLQQTAQGPDIGGEAASGAAAAQQAAQDVIGGTTPVRPLEELLAEAHTGAPVQAGGAAPAPLAPLPEADVGSIYDVEPRAHRIRDEVRRPPVSVEPPWKEAAETRARRTVFAVLSQDRKP